MFGTPLGQRGMVWLPFGGCGAVLLYYGEVWAGLGLLLKPLGHGGVVFFPVLRVWCSFAAYLPGEPHEAGEAFFRGRAVVGPALKGVRALQGVCDPFDGVMRGGMLFPFQGLGGFRGTFGA